MLTYAHYGNMTNMCWCTFVAILAMTVTVIWQPTLASAVLAQVLLFDMPRDLQSVVDFLSSLQQIQCDGYCLDPLDARWVAPYLNEDYQKNVLDSG